jgi:hypothetical protein
MNTWKPEGDWDSYKPLLFLALCETSGSIFEFGMGEGSTELLRGCQRPVFSFESNEEYFNKYKHLHNVTHVTNWETQECLIGLKNTSVVLIDHAPGEERHITLQKFADRNAIFIIHDSEPPPCGGNYMYDKIWNLFKYKVDLPGTSWTTAVSNTFDVTQWIGIDGVQKFRE